MVEQQRRRASDHDHLPPWLEALNIRQDAADKRSDAHEKVCVERHGENGKKHDLSLAMIAELRAVQVKAVLFLLSFAGSVILLLVKMK